MPTWRAVPRSGSAKRAALSLAQVLASAVIAGSRLLRWLRQNLRALRTGRKLHLRSAAKHIGDGVEGSSLHADRGRSLLLWSSSWS
jgi:hypothetical protein